MSRISNGQPPCSLAVLTSTWSRKPLLSFFPSQTTGAGRVLAWTQGSKVPVEGNRPPRRSQIPQPIRAVQKVQTWDSDSLGSPLFLL